MLLPSNYNRKTYILFFVVKSVSRIVDFGTLELNLQESIIWILSSEEGPDTKRLGIRFAILRGADLYLS